MVLRIFIPRGDWLNFHFTSFTFQKFVREAYKNFYLDSPLECPMRSTLFVKNFQPFPLANSSPRKMGSDERQRRSGLGEWGLSYRALCKITKRRLRTLRFLHCKIVDLLPFLPPPPPQVEKRLLRSALNPDGSETRSFLGGKLSPNWIYKTDCTSVGWWRFSQSDIQIILIKTSRKSRRHIAWFCFPTN